MKPVFAASGWLHGRCRTDLLGRLIENKTVPLDRFAARHYLGGAILFLFGVQAVTGLLLSLYYVPTVADAFESMETIMTRVEYGWLVRSVHKWSSHLMVAFIMAHLVAAFQSGAYQAPRELTWISGSLLLGIVLSICFFGYLLPWDERSFFATKTGIEIIRRIPLIGGNLINAVQGGAEFTSRTLTSFYVFHTVLLPAVFTGVLAIHIYLIQVHGVHEPGSEQGGVRAAEIGGMPFYPDFFKRILLFWIVLANLLLILCFVFPVELEEQADTFAAAPADIKPEWYFLGLYQTLKLMPAAVLFARGEMLALVGFSVGALFLVALPFVTGVKARSKRSRIAQGIAIALFVYAAAMSIWGFLDTPAGFD